MNNAPTDAEEMGNQPFDNVHAFEWYVWMKVKDPYVDEPPYPSGCYETNTFHDYEGSTIIIVCPETPSPTDAAGRDDE